MELIFIRHGQGFHNTDLPDRLNVVNPQLTDKGKDQVEELVSLFSCKDDDIFIVSPTIRTIETVNILTSKLSRAKKYISPLVGPRMFPLPEDPELFVSKCDMNYSFISIESHHRDFTIMNTDDLNLWRDGINIIPETEFMQLGHLMVDWIRKNANRRAFIISHDGTITCYRRLLGESELTRADFLGEAGCYKYIL